MTRIELAKKGIITDEMKVVASAEGISPERLVSDIAEGVTVITRNNLHDITPLGIGRGLKTKINANIGTSKDRVSYDEEIKKLEVLVKYGADAVMDLSTGGDIKGLRNTLIQKSPIAVGTVPVYETVVRITEKHGHIAKMTPDDLRAEIRVELERIGDLELASKVDVEVHKVGDNIDKLTAYMQDLRRRDAVEKDDEAIDGALDPIAQQEGV